MVSETADTPQTRVKVAPPGSSTDTLPVGSVWYDPATSSATVWITPPVTVSTLIFVLTPPGARLPPLTVSTWFCV